MRAGEPAAQLLAALGRRAGPGTTLDHVGEVPWSSATFVGAQHRVIVTGDTAWADALDDADLPMRACFVAGTEVSRTADGAILTVLVLEE